MVDEGCDPELVNLKMKVIITIIVDLANRRMNAPLK